MVTGMSQPGSSAEAQPEEEPTAGERAKLISLPVELVRAVRAWAATSPGKLGTMLIGLVVGSLVVGVVGSLMVFGKQSSLEDLVKHREPMSEASQVIYHSLTESEASAAAAFLSGDADAGKMHDDYAHALEVAGGALAIAAGDATKTPGVDDPARKLASLLPRYAGQLATAYANNRQGLPVGASYLVQASNLLHESMIEPAQILYGQQMTQLSGEEDDAGAVPWVVAALTVLLLIALILVQRHLRSRTNRTFNVGLVVSTVAVLAMLLWSAAALTISGLHVAAGKEQGSGQMLDLSRVRLLAVQARGSENLALVAKDADKYEKEFNDLIAKLQAEGGNGGLIGAAERKAAGTPIERDVRTAGESLNSWLKAHKSLRDKDSSGQGKQAVQQAVGTAADSAATQFGKVDAALDSAIKKARQEFVSSTDSAHNSLLLLDIGVIVLCVVAAAGAAGGLWQRIREYR